MIFKNILFNSGMLFGPQKRPKSSSGDTLPRDPKVAPRSPQGRPKGLPRGTQGTPEDPKGPQGTPPRVLGEPPGDPKAPQGPPRTPKAPKSDQKYTQNDQFWTQKRSKTLPKTIVVDCFSFLGFFIISSAFCLFLFSVIAVAIRIHFLIDCFFNVLASGPWMGSAGVAKR